MQKSNHANLNEGQAWYTGNLLPTTNNQLGEAICALGFAEPQEDLCAQAAWPRPVGVRQHTDTDKVTLSTAWLTSGVRFCFLPKFFIT